MTSNPAVESVQLRGWGCIKPCPWLIAACLIVMASPVAAKTDRALSKAANRLISQISKEDPCAHENIDARRYHYIDLNADGALDAVMMFTIEGAGCGNNYSFHMAVFHKQGNDYQLADHAPVGGKWRRDVDFDKVTFRDGQIYLSTLEYRTGGPHPDPACCPSLKRKARFGVKEWKLVEIKRSEKQSADAEQ